MNQYDWEKKTLSTELTDKCRALFSEAVGDGWREVAGTIIMDSDNRVVGFAMCLHKDGKGKEIVIAAPPELQSQCEAAMEREPEDVVTQPHGNPFK